MILGALVPRTSLRPLAIEPHSHLRDSWSLRRRSRLVAGSPYGGVAHPLVRVQTTSDIPCKRLLKLTASQLTNPPDARSGEVQN